MKCPECGSEAVYEHRKFTVPVCPQCQDIIEEPHPLGYGPAELLDLIEKADPMMPAVIVLRKLVLAIKQYLSGDPSALKKLAGVE